MKTKLIGKCSSLLLVFFCIFSSLLTAQEKKKYATYGGELIFSWADAKQDGEALDVTMRFSPVFNLQNQFHRDFNQHFGLFTGINIRNVGFIFDDPDLINTKYKVRTYTLGVPIALKLGNMDGFFLFGGYEIEFPFNYKQKTFVNENKEDKETSWFSNKTPTFYNTVFAGMQTMDGIQLKFKYYLTNFFNTDYSANDGANNTIYPYQKYDAKIFYVSLSFQIFKGKRLIFKKGQES